jgi:hypothetical protein
MGKIRYRRKPHCAFCSNKPDSKEHAWPEWIINRLYTGTQRIIGSIEGNKAQVDATQKALKVPCVCEPCNSGWMHQLEDTVIPLMTPMLDGADTKLNIPHQWIMARWAIKTAMIFEYATHERSLFYTDEERSAFKPPLSASPTFSFAWLGHYTPGAEGFTIATFGMDGYAANAAGPSIAPYQTTLVFGHLLIQVVTVRPNESETRTAVIHPQPGPWHLNSVRIWPPQKAIAWPPVIAVDDTNFWGFHRRWDNPSMEWGGHTQDDVILIPR